MVISFPPQQWLRERAPMLRYSYIACLVNSEGYEREMAEFRKHPVFMDQLRVLYCSLYHYR